ncbi:MAG: C-terminal processing peptidase-3, Serine peptidase family [Bacteroidota bacterium]|jgi:carboxyl-terminal processing protease
MIKTRVQHQIHKHRKGILCILIALPIALMSARVADNYFEVSKNMEIFTDVYKELNIYYVDDTKPGAMMKSGIDAMLRSLDPYTVYYPESKIEDAMFMQTGQYGGIGTLVNTINGKITITEPYQNYPAAKSGLLAGDVVIKVDGVNVEGKVHDDISDMLTGQPGSKVTITIMRPGESSPRQIELTREEIKVPDVPYYGMMDKTMGYIKLNSFTQTASSEVKAAFLALKKQNMTELVLDLRGNGGGLMREAINIVNFFVPKGTEVVRTKGKISEWNKTFYASVEPIDTQIPIVVLVDGMSASASEIVSGSLQDLDRAVVVGTESYGKGLVQQTKDLAYNTKLKLTVAKYYTPSGRCIQRLDYSHRDKETGKVTAVADSAIKSFKTKSGRTVFDGRGISPDRPLPDDAAPHVLVALVENWVSFDWANQYKATHNAIDSADRFRLTDKEYDDFVQFALTRSFNYETGTEKYFADMLKAAKDEKYYEGAEAAFDQLNARIKPDKSSDLRKFKKQIKEYLENEIVARYYYQDGRIKNSLPIDPYIAKAREILDSDYAKILIGPNTGK